MRWATAVANSIRLSSASGAAQSSAVSGQAPWSAPSPAGWPDTAELWAAPDALLKRIEFATAVAQRIGDRLDPRALAKAVIAPVAAPETGTTIARAPSRSDGLTLLLASAEFQRR